MELIAILFMLLAGGGLAVFALTAVAIAQKEGAMRGPRETDAASERDRIAASLLFQVLTAGGIHGDEALREIRRRAGLASPVTRGIDVPNWAESYARIASREQRAFLLESAVALIASREKPVPVRQYATLLDLSFGLGFQTDALARLREQYGFEYVDPARHGRPREADRGGGATPLFVREPRDDGELLGVLGLSGGASRQTIIAAYRKLAAQHHPDRFHGHAPDVQSDAAARFIEITRAYESLLAKYRD